MQKTKGTIFSIHFNKKSGRIKDEHDSIIKFDKKDLLKSVKLRRDLIGAAVDFYSEFDDGNVIAKEISLTGQTINIDHRKLVGEVFEGQVKDVLDYGVFVRFNDIPDGLLHKNDLPTNMRDAFKEIFTKGKMVKVIIEDVSEIGIQLKLAEDSN